MENFYDWILKRKEQTLINQLLNSGLIIKSFFDETEKANNIELKNSLVKKIIEDVSNLGYVIKNENDILECEKKFIQSKNALEKSVGDLILKSQYEQILKVVAMSFLDFSQTDIKKMAISNQDLKKIKDASDPDAENIVSSAFHIENHPAPKEYHQMISASKKYESKKDLNNVGISTKTVHTINPSLSIMTKPYHKKIELDDPAINTWCRNPTSGWATIATKALFNAGNIGHLCEDVSTHKIDDTPVTVHKFSPDYTEVMDLYRDQNKFDLIKKTKPLQFKQIAAIDFLTNNLDRHCGNIMQSDNLDKEGKSNLLAIDHERNFQYFRNPYTQFADTATIVKSPDLSEKDKGKISLADFFKRGLESHYNDWKEKVSNKEEEEGFEDLKYWWNKHSDPIKKEFLKHVQHISNPDVREHVMKNFIERHQAFDNWSKSEKSSLLPEIESKENLSEEKLLEPFQNKKANETAQMISNVVSAFSENKKRLSPLMRKKLISQFSANINNADPMDLAEAYESVHTNISHSKNKDAEAMAHLMLNEIIHKIYKHEDTQPSVAAGHILSILNKISKIKDSFKNESGSASRPNLGFLRLNEDERALGTVFNRLKNKGAA